jgi:hypothetical protein
MASLGMWRGVVDASKLEQEGQTVPGKTLSGISAFLLWYMSVCCLVIFAGSFFLCFPARCIAVQCSAVQCSAVQCSAAPPLTLLTPPQLFQARRLLDQVGQLDQQNHDSNVLAQVVAVWARHQPVLIESEPPENGANRKRNRHRNVVK